MTTKYISIKAVLAELSITIDSRYWNEMVMLEHATHALRMVGVAPNLQQAVSLQDVTKHKSQLPLDLQFLTQVAYKTRSDLTNIQGLAQELALPNNSGWFTDNSGISRIGFSPMRLATNPYHNSICLDEHIANCPDCKHSFTVSPSLVLTTTLKDGHILVAYLKFPTDDNGDALMPDDETLKEAIFHYVLYRYWLSKYQMKEDGADTRIKFHLNMWSTLKVKALNLNLPDVNEIENLKNIRNRLVPRSSRFDQLFLTLGNRENIDF